MRCASSKLHTRARMRELGLNAAQARNWPSCDSTRTVSPLSPPPLAMADSKIQGWRRKSERSLPGRRRRVFIPGLSQEAGRPPTNPPKTSGAAHRRTGGHGFPLPGLIRVKKRLPDLQRVIHQRSVTERPHNPQGTAPPCASTTPQRRFPSSPEAAGPRSPGATAMRPTAPTHRIETTPALFVVHGCMPPRHTWPGCTCPSSQDSSTCHGRSGVASLRAQAGNASDTPNPAACATRALRSGEYS